MAPDSVPHESGCVVPGPLHALQLVIYLFPKIIVVYADRTKYYVYFINTH